MATSAAILTTMLAGQPEHKSWRLRQSPEELRPAIARADLVILTTQSEVLRELNAAIAWGGVPKSLAFCHVDVLNVIERVGREEGVAAGRTSDRLRNPANVPRPWAASFVAAHAGWSAKDIDGTPSISATRWASSVPSSNSRCAAPATAAKRVLRLASD